MSKSKLELTWIGKDKRLKLEPRILLHPKDGSIWISIDDREMAYLKTLKTILMVRGNLFP